MIICQFFFVIMATKIVAFTHKLKQNCNYVIRIAIGIFNDGVELITYYFLTIYNKNLFNYEADKRQSSSETCTRRREN